MPSLVKLAAVFALIIFLLWRKLNLGLALVVGAVVLGLWFSMTPLDLAVACLKASVDAETLSVVAALILIMVYEHFMKEDGILADFIAGARGFFRDRRLVMAFMPAFIGFLPSAGGALFSAPMVREVSEDLPLTGEMRAFFNYWFRHVWEFFLPLYPGVLIATQVSGVPLSSFMVFQMRFSVLAITLGVIIAFRGRVWRQRTLSPDGGTSTYREATAWSRKTGENLALMARGLLPMACIIALVVLFDMEVALAVGLVLAGLLVLRRYDPRKLPGLARRSISLPAAFLVVGAMMFKEVLKASGAVDRIPAELIPLGIHPVFMMMVLAFIAGLLTGYSPAGVAVSFPLLTSVSAMSAAGSPSSEALALASGAPLAGLMFVTGFAGVMLSPTHLCFALTVDYFKAQFGRVWNKVLLGEAVLVLAAIASFILAGGLS